MQYETTGTRRRPRTHLARFHERHTTATTGMNYPRIVALDAILAHSRAIHEELAIREVVDSEVSISFVLSASSVHDLQGFFNVGVFVHNQWERACIVPVPYRRGAMDMTSRVGHLALDAWITRPFESHTVNWTLVTKETETHVVHYYSMSEDRAATTNYIPRTVHIGDVLFLKVDQGGIIDADQTDAESVLRDIMSLV